MFRKPRFSPVYDVRVVEEGVLLVDEDGYVLLGGIVCRLLAAFLDGDHTADEIVRALEREVGAAEVYYTLMRLEDRGYLAEGDTAVDPARAALWARFGAGVDTAGQRLRTTAVSLWGMAGMEVGPVAELLESEGVRIAEEAAFTLVLTPDYLEPGLEAFNRAAAGGWPYLLARVSGASVWIGPLVEPGHTGCWACLAHFQSM